LFLPPSISFLPLLFNLLLLLRPLLLLLHFVLRPPICFPSQLILSYESYRQSVGLLGRGISPLQGCYLRRTTQIQNKLRQTPMLRVGFEHTILVFEREKTFYALHSAAIVIGHFLFLISKYSPDRRFQLPSMNIASLRAGYKIS
jgi:hypothetical protein